MDDIPKCARLSINKMLLKIERFILMVVPILVMLLLVTSVVMRYIFKMDLFGIEELMAIVAMWMYMIGAAYASYENSHIRADILETFIQNPKTKALFKIIENIIVLIVLVPFVYWGLQYASWNIASGNKTAFWKLPMLLSQIPITIGLILMLIYTIIHLIKITRRYREL